MVGHALEWLGVSGPCEVGSLTLFVFLNGEEKGVILDHIYSLSQGLSGWVVLSTISIQVLFLSRHVGWRCLICLLWLAFCFEVEGMEGGVFCACCHGLFWVSSIVFMVNNC